MALKVEHSNCKKNIAKNTLLLYIRMLFIMSISLYTSRVILKVLGIEDYGIYNVVGGVVIMFSFLSSAMSSSTQRYITFELGKKNFQQLQKVFNTCLYIHIFISVLIFILAETIGLWFLQYKMSIPLERQEAAVWVYQCTIISTLFLIINVPYNATIIAHEKMSAFAYISIFEVTIKLITVYLLYLGSFDKLKLYALLMLSIQLIINLTYSVYCRKKFQETKIQKIKKLDLNLFKELLNFTGWNLWGNCAGIAFTQGINILLNIFFGPITNAARGIAVQVQSAVNQFSYNFQTALNPQITKSYAAEDYNYMHNLIFKSSKFTFFLLLLLTLPIFFKTEIILKLWLETIPNHTIQFLRLILCVTIIDAVANPLMTSATATGKIKKYQTIVGCTLLSILPISYITLKLGGNPESVFIVHLTISIIAFIIRLSIVSQLIQLNIHTYIKKVIYRSLLVTIISLIIPTIAENYINNTLIGLLQMTFCCIISSSISIYFYGLEPSEIQYINNKIRILANKIKK